MDLARAIYQREAKLQAVRPNGYSRRSDGSGAIVRND